jgi:hypothetical protein
MEEGKDHYLGEASKSEIWEELVRHLGLGSWGGRERERRRIEWEGDEEGSHDAALVAKPRHWVGTRRAMGLSLK